MFDLRVGGTDLEAATALFADEYKIPNFASSPSEAPFEWGHSIHGDEVMTFRSSTFQANLSGITEADDDCIVWWNRTGRSVIGTGRSAHHVLTDSPQLLSRTSPTAIRHFDVVQNLVHINHKFVRRVANELPDRFPGFVSFEAGAPPSEAAQLSWRRAVNGVAALWLDRDNEPGAILRNELSRAVAIGLLESFAFVTSDIADSHCASASVVKLAIDFAYDNAHGPLSGSDLAQAVGLSPRSLQQSFRRHLNTTPTAVISSIRLRRVQEELAHHTPETAVIADVARRWGFIHLGRFASAYYALFNELPRETLRN